jgi:hypothetical protein
VRPLGTSATNTAYCTSPNDDDDDDGEYGVVGGMIGKGN